mmetsp:Transcript_9418/g.28371  ORF Transcript_9418/g.28371 Transcript_9418/m.28371 type:complete len:270 (-) Transcript_9418:424-1233(-)
MPRRCGAPGGGTPRALVPFPVGGGTSFRMRRRRTRAWGARRALWRRRTGLRPRSGPSWSGGPGPGRRGSHEQRPAPSRRWTAGPAFEWRRSSASRTPMPLRPASWQISRPLRKGRARPQESPAAGIPRGAPDARPAPRRWPHGRRAWWPPMSQACPSPPPSTRHAPRSLPPKRSPREEASRPRAPTGSPPRSPRPSWLRSPGTGRLPRRPPGPPARDRGGSGRRGRTTARIERRPAAMRPGPRRSSVLHSLPPSTPRPGRASRRNPQTR